MIDFVINCELAISNAPTASSKNTGWNLTLPLELNDPTRIDAKILPPIASNTAIYCNEFSDSPNIAHASNAT
jgi:hypothetical protein